MKTKLALGLLLITSVAHAQAPPKFDYGKAPEVKDVEWKASASSGLVLTSGNSHVLTLSGGAVISRKDVDNGLTLEGAFAFAKSSILVASDANMDGKIGPGEFDRVDSTTAKNWVAKLRYDRFFAESNSAFVAARIGADEIAGKDLFGGGQIGYSRRIFKDDSNELVAELGYDFTYESYVAPGVDALSIHSLRAFVGYTGKLTDDTGLLANVEGLFNLNTENAPPGNISAFQDTRINAKAALTTKIAKHIDFRVAFLLKFDNAPAPLPPFALPYAAGFVPLAETVDTQTEATIIVNFL